LLCLCCKASWGRGYVGVSFTKSRALVEWSGSRVKAFFPHSRSISDLSQGKEDEHHLFPVVQESCCEDIATATTHAHKNYRPNAHLFLSMPFSQRPPIRMSRGILHSAHSPTSDAPPPVLFPSYSLILSKPRHVSGISELGKLDSGNAAIGVASVCRRWRRRCRIGITGGRGMGGMLTEKWLVSEALVLQLDRLNGGFKRKDDHKAHLKKPE